uniref:Transposase n=1 Tax=Ascaris lumbricoides TaxID=6252 RepID=A0A0M3HIA6_ASCLU
MRKLITYARTHLHRKYDIDAILVAIIESTKTNVLSSFTKRLYYGFFCIFDFQAML